MAQEQPTQGIQNIWLIVIAVVLGLVVVFLYNAHIRAIRKAQDENVMSVAKALRRINPGDKLAKNKNIVEVKIPRNKATKKGLGDVVMWKDVHQLIINKDQPVNQVIEKGLFIRYSHVTRDGEKNLVRLEWDMVGISIEFDTKQSPGDILRPGSLISLKGMFSVNGQPYKTYRIISDVRVLSVGGRGKEGSRRSNPTSYRQITIEVSQEVSLQLSNLLTHLVGDLQLELRGWTLTPPGNPGILNEKLKSLYEKAQPSARSGRFMDTIGSERP